MTGGADRWRVAFVIVVVFPTRVDAAATAVLQILDGHAPAIEDLHFVARLNVHA